MSPIFLVSLVDIFIGGIFALALVVMSFWALAVALQASNYAYQSAGKRTKTFWVAVTVACAIFSLLTLVSTVGGGNTNWLLQLIVATASGVFLADVRPAVAVRSRR